MYNRYLKSGSFEELFKPAENGDAASASPDFRKRGQPEDMPPRRAETETSGKNQSKNASSLKSLLGGSLKLPELNSDTLLLLVLVYFLVADEGENISDTLLIIGVLLLLGF